MRTFHCSSSLHGLPLRAKKYFSNALDGFGGVTLGIRTIYPLCKANVPTEPGIPMSLAQPNT